MPIVAAVASSSGRAGQKGKTAHEVEAAMSQAVRDAFAAGIIDPDETRELMLQARARVLGLT